MGIDSPYDSRVQKALDKWLPMDDPHENEPESLSPVANHPRSSTGNTAPHPRGDALDRGDPPADAQSRLGSDDDRIHPGKPVAAAHLRGRLAELRKPDALDLGRPPADAQSRLGSDLPAPPVAGR